jgi:diguanylate cyclase (GGDEF)-like protein/PAS domain S-box-containing protein
MFFQRLSLTWLFTGTVGLLFILYLVSAVFSTFITRKAYDDVNQLITIHDSIGDIYRQLKIKSYSTRRMVELNLLNEQMSLDETLESIEWLNQSFENISHIFIQENQVNDIDLKIKKIRYLLVSARNVEDETADDIYGIINETSILLNEIQSLVLQNFGQTIKINKDLAGLKKIIQKTNNFDADFDLVSTSINTFLNQPPSYKNLVNDLFVEQSREVEKLKAIILEHHDFKTIDYDALEQSHKLLRFLTNKFYLNYENVDLQSDGYIELGRNVENSLEHYESLLNYQEERVDHIIDDISSGLSINLKKHEKLIFLYLLAGAVIAIICMTFFVFITYSRLNTLRNTVLSIAEGNLNQNKLTDSQSNDLVSSIIKAFNLMLQSITERDRQIQYHIKELSGHHQQLEQTVKLRTEELLTQNKLLEEEIILRKNKELRLMLSDLALANTSEAVFITGEDGIIVEANPAFCNISGYTRKEILGQKPSLLKSGKQSDAFYKGMREILDKQGIWNGEIINRRKSGELFPVWETINSVLNEEGKVTNYVSVFRDISKLKQAEKELHNLAYYDHLTKLPNRTLFYGYLEHEITTAKRNHTKIAVFFIDLDRFKNVNDTLGHLTGDRLLVEVSQRLQYIIRESDIVARQGGDEFLILLPGINDVNQVALTAGKINRELKAPFFFSKTEVHIDSSIGISIYPNDGDTVEQLIKHSDIAMYASKNTGRGHYKFFDALMNKKNLVRQKIEQRLNHAIENKSFELYFQPQINKDAAIVGAEALIRWQDSELGNVPPDIFIPIAEEMGMVHLITDQVIEMACKHIRDWKQQNLYYFTLSINVSAQDILRHNFVDSLKEKIQNYGLKHQDIGLEITETAILDNFEDADTVLTRLNQAGFTMILDDFGTGYSSLAYLHRLPINRLKIDRSFVKDIPENANSMTITKAIIKLAKSMDIQIVAEGVESKQQTDFLWLDGCDYCQGYEISKPLPLDKFIVFIKR